MKHQTVENLMTREVVSVRADTTLKEIATLLTEHDISGVPVTDFAGRVIGVVSEADLVRPRPQSGLDHRRRWRPRPQRRPRLRTDLTAAHLMTIPAVTVSADTEVTTAAQLFTDRQIKRLPVVDTDDRLVGILTRHDLIRVFVRPDEEIMAEIRDEVLPRELLVDPAGIDVEVHSGVATLRGQLGRASLVPIATALTRRVDGVIDVVNDLTYGTDDSTFGDGTAPQNVGILHRSRQV
jgi:CBS-domain-containing membrane protein